MIYADNAATTKMSEAAVHTMISVINENYGNPSSLYSIGQQAKETLEEARKTVAEAIGAEPREILFTSGGSEADNQAIRSMAEEGKKKGKTHIISSAFEHHAVLHTLEKLKKEGFEITLLDVHEDGLVRPEELEQAIREDTCLVTIMYANNEIGTIQPIREIGAVCRKHGIPFHTDAVQAVGTVPVDVNGTGCDLLSLSAHKFYGPKGIGVLYIRQGTRLMPLIAGGEQERGLRAGTENVPAIVGLGRAISIAVKDRAENAKRMRDRLVAGILNDVPGTALNGCAEDRLPNNCSFRFDGIDGEALLLRLDLAGIAASAGSACTAGSREISHVLKAIGLTEKEAKSSLRLTTGIHTTEEEADETVRTVGAIVRDLRNLFPGV